MSKAFYRSLSTTVTYVLRYEYTGLDVDVRTIFEHAHVQEKLAGWDLRWFVGWAHLQKKGKEFRYEIVRKLDGQVYFAMSPTVEPSHKVCQERRKNKRARID